MPRAAARRAGPSPLPVLGDNPRALPPRERDDVVRQVLDAAAIPRPLPPAEREEPIKDASGEAPDEHPGDFERGTDESARVPDRQPVARLGEIGHGYARDRGDLVRVGGRDLTRLAPPGENRRDDVRRRRHPKIREYG